MAAAKGNKYAEKWTVEEARILANKALECVNDGEDGEDQCFFISDIADKCDVYRQLFEYLIEKFNDDQEVFNTIKRVYNKCETIIWKLSATGCIDKTIGIFALKSLHGLYETSHLHTTEEKQTERKEEEFFDPEDNEEE